MKFSKDCFRFTICLTLHDREAQLLTLHTVPLAWSFPELYVNSVFFNIRISFSTLSLLVYRLSVYFRTSVVTKESQLKKLCLRWWIGNPWFLPIAGIELGIYMYQFVVQWTRFVQSEWIRIACDTNCVIPVILFIYPI